MGEQMPSEAWNKFLQDRLPLSKAVVKLKVATGKRDSAVNKVKVARLLHKNNIDRYINGKIDKKTVDDSKRRLQSARANWGLWYNRTIRYKEEVDRLKSKFNIDNNKCDECGLSGTFRDSGYVLCDFCFERV
jgi:hypothetical protein